jgi:hypothetical protein
LLTLVWLKPLLGKPNAKSLQNHSARIPSNSEYLIDFRTITNGDASLFGLTQFPSQSEIPAWPGEANNSIELHMFLRNFRFRVLAGNANKHNGRMPINSEDLSPTTPSPLGFLLLSFTGNTHSSFITSPGRISPLTTLTNRRREGIST